MSYRWFRLCFYTVSLCVNQRYVIGTEVLRLTEHLWKICSAVTVAPNSPGNLKY